MTESRSDLTGATRRGRRTMWIIVVLCIAAAGAAWWIFRPGHDAAEQVARGRTAGAANGGAARGGGGRGGRRGAGPTDAAIPVQVATARKQDIPIYLDALGTVTAYNTVTVHTRVSGELVKVAFEEGQRVKAGDFLAQVDPRPLQIALSQAQGTQQQNQALLANARRDLQRYQALSKQESIARQQVDTQAALVRQYEGTDKLNQAAVDSAKLQLEFARITAPISGRLGLRQVDRGNLVATSDTNGLVVITQTQPIAVVFTLPETQLPEVLSQVHGGKTLSVDAYDRAATRKIASGVLETLDNQIDVTTGTIKLKARFANDDEMLFPNQFINVKLLVETRHDAIAIPTVAVQQGATGSFAFVVKPDNTVTVRQIELGPIYKDMVAVNKGLQAGERVVMEGIDRLREGAKIDIVTPKAATPGALGAAAAANPAGTPGTPGAAGSTGGTGATGTTAGPTTPASAPALPPPDPPAPASTAGPTPAAPSRPARSRAAPPSATPSPAAPSSASPSPASPATVEPGRS